MPEAPPVWRAQTLRALDRLARAGGTVMLLGATDAGKTTLACELVNRGLAAGLHVAVVDADVGQSDIGPPTTVGLGYPAGPIASLAEVPLSRLYFVGDTSPARHLLPEVVGTAQMVREARAQGCRLIVVDTTGMVTGRLAQVLKFHKVQAVSPRALVAIQEKAELEPLLAPFAGPGGPLIVRLPVAAGVQTKSLDERRERRRHAWAGYFAGARALALDRSVVTLWPPVAPRQWPELAGLACGLLDGRGAALAAGILQEVNPYVATVLTPLPDAGEVATVQVGDVRVTPAGDEVGRE